MIKAINHHLGAPLLSNSMEGKLLDVERNKGMFSAYASDDPMKRSIARIIDSTKAFVAIVKAVPIPVGELFEGLDLEGVTLTQEINEQEFEVPPTYVSELITALVGDVMNPSISQLQSALGLVGINMRGPKTHSVN